MIDKYRKPRCIAAGWIALVLLFLPCAVSAQNLQPSGINLGGSSFFDGFGGEGGFTLIEYLQWASSRRFNGERPLVDSAGNITGEGDGTKISPFVNDPKFDAVVLLNQLIYTIPDAIFDDTAHVGVHFIVPFVFFETSFAGPPPGPAVQLRDNGFGVGDVSFGPVLQFRPVISGGRPIFANRIGFDTIVPTGDYDPDIDINQSSNFVSINPSWAFTVLPASFFEISARLNYLYNFKNYRPAVSDRVYGLEYPPKIKSAQAGQAGWINFALSFGLFPHIFDVDTELNIGVSGYYFHQFNLDKWDYQDGSSDRGVDFMDTGMAKIFGIGPGVFWKALKHDMFFVNLYFQPLVENRAQCTVTQLRWIHGF